MRARAADPVDRPRHGPKEATVALRAGTSLLVHSVEDVPVDQQLQRLGKENRTIYCPSPTAPSSAPVTEAPV